MLYAVKGNKQLKIEETEMSRYLNLGYDVAKEEDGKLVPVKESPSKTITVAQHKLALDENAKIKDEIEALQDENKALKEQLLNNDSAEQVEALQKENKDLKAQLAEAKKQPKADK
ncbi:hypothetical protein D3C77_582760 [compost metagenome]